MLNPKNKFPLSVYLLPLLHLCACVLITVANIDGWGAMFVVDLPVSLLIAPLPWYSIHPLVAFGILGTLWWYVLSTLFYRYAIRYDRRETQSNTNP